MNNLGLGDNTSICLYETYGNVHSLNNSAMATLRSVAGPKGTNELKLQHLYTLEESMPGDELPSSNIPRAVVSNVESQIDGKTATTSIQLGDSAIALKTSTIMCFSLSIISTTIQTKSIIRLE